MQIFFRDAAAAFVVFDLTRRATFEAVRRWKEDLDSKVVTSDGAKVGHDVIGVSVDSNFTFSIPQIPTILLANKSDLTEARSVSDDEVYQLYSAVYSVQYMYRCTGCPRSWASPPGTRSRPGTATTWTRRAT